MSISQTSAPAAINVGLARLPIDKPQPAVDFLHARGGGVMDLIAHFWDRLPQTPALARGDLHLVVASPQWTDHQTPFLDPSLTPVDPSLIAGAMLYVPKAHRADVLATTPAAAEAFARYIAKAGAPPPATEPPPETSPPTDSPPKRPPAEARIAIDFLTGAADGLAAMIPLLLPLVHKRVPARELVNVVMQLPSTTAPDPQNTPDTPNPCVRLAKDGDNATLNRWRTLYKQERGILFDADVDAWVQSGKVFVYEHDGAIVALAKFDLDLPRLVEIGGVFTFPEYRKQGFGGRLVTALAQRIRQLGKTPTLQVDTQNTAALRLYQHLGWVNMGRLARVWLTG